MLAVGRFAFLPMHRRDLERSVAVSGPKTTGRLYTYGLHGTVLGLLSGGHCIICFEGRTCSVNDHG